MMESLNSPVIEMYREEVWVGVTAGFYPISTRFPCAISMDILSLVGASVDF